MDKAQKPISLIQQPSSEAFRIEWPFDLSHELVFDARSDTGAVGSNPTRGIDACLRLVIVFLCLGSGLVAK
jgi:hypothetical protein